MDNSVIHYHKCLSGKTASNGRLRKSRIDILWGMFYKENVDYLELIWEDFAFQIDHRKEKKSRCETIPFPRFTKVIINHFLSQHKSLFNLKYQHYHTIKDDGIIKQSESYQMFIKYSTCQIPPKKSRGKGSQRKKTADTLVIDVMVSEESDTEPSTKRTASRSVIKKKATISVVDNIIPDPDVALELSKSISLTEAIEEETTRQVHATHARIVTKSVPEPARRRPSGIAFRDTSRVSKKVSSDPSQKLKGVQSLTPEEQEAADTMQALKESKKTSRRQPGTGGSSEGTGRIPGVLNESTVISATSVKEKVTSEANVILEWEMTDDEETKDEFVHGDEQVNDDEHEEMSNVEVKDSRKGDAELSDVAKADAEKIEEIKDDAKKGKLPPTSSSLSLRVAKLEKGVSELKEIDYFAETLTSLKNTTDFIEKHYVKPTPESSKIQKPTINLKQESEKSASKIFKIRREQAEKQKMPKYTIKSTDKEALKEYDQKSALYQAMYENKSFNKNLANHALYHALMEALIEDENAMDKGVADTVKNHKIQHDNDDDDDDEDPSVGPNQVIDTLLTNEATSDQEIDDPYISMEECIQLMADKGHRRGQEFNWETATYGTIFRMPPYLFNYPTRSLTLEEILAKFIDEGHCHPGPTSGHHGAKVTARKLGRKSRLMQLNELAELRVGAYENTRIYKERTKKWHDSRHHGEKDFKEGNKVLLYNSRLKMYPGKLKSKWSGSNIVKMVYPYGAVKITDENRFRFKVNGQQLKKYYEGNINKEDHEVIEFENGIT
ncbi:hypothetical protein Tco_0525219 [Tanacetum coccineum]